MRVFARRWKQGEHVFINGQTGSGKTDMLLRLMQLREHGVVFVTKPRDPIFKSPLASNFVRQTKWAPKHGVKKIFLSAPIGDSSREQVGNQREIFGEAMDKIYIDGAWAVGVDETFWISKKLGLSSEVENFSFMGRALGITAITAMQRPRNIPVLVPQSATHAFISKTGHRDDLKTLSYLDTDSGALESALRSLRDPHEFVYVDTAGKLPMMVVNTHR